MMTRANEITVYQGALPAEVSRRVEVEFSRQMERIVATGEIGMAGMTALSEVERHATFKVATTAAAAALLARGAAATHGTSSVESQAQQKLFEGYARRMAQLAEMTNIKILQSVDRATDEFSKHTYVDAVEDFSARLSDTLIGRPDRKALPQGRR